MNAAHLHLILNHFPVIGLLFGLAILAVAQLRKNRDLARAGMITLVAIAIITIPTYLTGEPAEDVLQDMPGFSSEIVEEHEEAALIAIVLTEMVGIVALAGLVAYRPPKVAPNWFVPTLLLLSLVAVGWVAWTSSLGGRVSHEEARPGFRVEIE
ncbi:MAG: hypothetical protein PVI01_17300 [Gemmatimonadales bacterium]|jgi:uncharacterized membrane protein